MRYRPSALVLLLFFLAFPSLPLAQTKGTEGYVDAGGGVRLFYRLVGTGRDTLVIIHGGAGRKVAVYRAGITAGGSLLMGKTLITAKKIGSIRHRLIAARLLPL
jgi:hypothetical protein